ncbi:uncharacterized protein si:ch211-269k10.4 isoform X1 [Anguilla anguilla]|uniref:uncharacterized protein si:ch211-269k10.4 isoform X1 n=1 Tax=Anguilla anguilla TaxID=7936 RepID=UPI0015AC5BCE|nr:uncharacterized protein si:ch211-269k10.4 isoform X1 [Anguilla anguilla]XP_035290720.1 uncharacterized protein si:ch211-269k10.4 isoform X1 [Anguilla anguilla]XP_035290730.1 uncharacterized protein si:ch211-269k10.4 isoform X1 [Anguilla anguilla]
MASAIFSMSDITEQEEEETGTRQPLIRQYCATEQIPGKELPLQDLLRKQPMALGVAQLVAGITSFGLGVTLAATSPLTLAVLLRVPILTGLLYIICGLLSALLNRFTRLLPICFVVNIGCLSVAGVGIVLLAIDLSLLTDSERAVRPTKVLILCVIALMACISALLVFWLHREMRSMRKKF